MILFGNLRVFETSSSRLGDAKSEILFRIRNVVTTLLKPRLGLDARGGRGLDARMRCGLGHCRGRRSGGRHRHCVKNRNLGYIPLHDVGKGVFAGLCPNPVLLNGLSADEDSEGFCLVKAQLF